MPPTASTLPHWWRFVGGIVRAPADLWQYHNTYNKVLGLPPLEPVDR